jgi:uncharacterized protein
VKVAGKEVALQLDTRYPWDGAVRLTVKPEARARFAVRVRIPGWAQNTPVPGDLYTFSDKSSDPVVLEVNGQPMRFYCIEGTGNGTEVWNLVAPEDAALTSLPYQMQVWIPTEFRSLKVGA